MQKEQRWAERSLLLCLQRSVILTLMTFALFSTRKTLRTPGISSLAANDKVSPSPPQPAGPQHGCCAALQGLTGLEGWFCPTVAQSSLSDLQCSLETDCLYQVSAFRTPHTTVAVTDPRLLAS